MFAKVFEQIFDSSISEDYQVRLVFEDFLTLADCDGVVDKTPEAIARRTNVPLKIVQRAIKVLETPDPKSRRPDDDGRRICRLEEHRDWGWFVVNYDYYRNLASEEQRREKTRLRVRRFRERCNADVTPHNDSPSASASASSSSSSSLKEGGYKGGDFDAFWSAYPRKVGKKAALKAWLAVKDKPELSVVLAAIERQKASDQWRKDGGQYIPHPATWLHQGRWEDEVTVKPETPIYRQPPIEKGQ